MTDAVPDDVMKRAEEAYHRQLLRYDREDGIAIIARALMEERRLAQRELLEEIRAAAIRGQP